MLLGKEVREITEERPEALPRCECDRREQDAPRSRASFRWARYGIQPMSVPTTANVVTETDVYIKFKCSSFMEVLCLRRGHDGE